ncbi:MAG TPA: hypothetical protein VHB21_25610 [Minicystis sp.]|nr:hypothetical protein [Minicystis sp.]
MACLLLAGATGCATEPELPAADTAVDAAALGQDAPGAGAAAQDDPAGDDATDAAGDAYDAYDPAAVGVVDEGATLDPVVTATGAAAYAAVPPPAAVFVGGSRYRAWGPRRVIAPRWARLGRGRGVVWNRWHAGGHALGRHGGAVGHAPPRHVAAHAHAVGGGHAHRR